MENLYNCIITQKRWKPFGKRRNCSFWAISPFVTLFSKVVSCRCLKMRLHVGNLLGKNVEIRKCSFCGRCGFFLWIITYPLNLIGERSRICRWIAVLMWLHEWTVSNQDIATHRFTPMHPKMCTASSHTKKHSFIGTYLVLCTFRHFKRPFG